MNYHRRPLALQHNKSLGALLSAAAVSCQRLAEAGIIRENAAVHRSFALRPG